MYNRQVSGQPLRIDLSSRVPVYKQITDGLRAELVAGRFPAGTKLVPVRALAVDLGVHHNTVAEAYRQLADEGWLELRRYHGAIVCERRFPRARADAAERFAQPLRELIAKALSDGMPAESVARELTANALRLEGEAVS
jgi:GntR family transcriptional regulator